MPTLLPARTALVAIDPQAWTLGMPMAPHPAPEVVANLHRLAATLRASGGTVILTRVAFSPGDPDRLRTPVDAPMRLPEGGIPREGLGFPPGIEAIADLVITKRQWSAFHGTELDLQLRRRNIETVILGGIMTNFGVESTARDAWQHNYAVLVAEDACSAPDEAMHRFSLEKILPRVGRIRSTAEILRALGGA